MPRRGEGVRRARVAAALAAGLLALSAVPAALAVEDPPGDVPTPNVDVVDFDSGIVPPGDPFDIPNTVDGVTVFGLFTFAGPWPPPPGTFSFFAAFSMFFTDPGDADGLIHLSAVTQEHDGEQGTFPQCPPDSASCPPEPPPVQAHVLPNGQLLLVTKIPYVPDTIQMRAQSGVLPTSDGQISQDQVPDDGTPVDVDMTPRSPVVTQTEETTTTTTTSSTSTTTTTVATTTTEAEAAAAPSAGEEADDPVDAATSPLVFVLGGLVVLAGLGLLGWWWWGRRTGPCDDERVAWQAAQRRCDTAREELEKARAYHEEKRAAATELRGELGELERARGSSVDEGGNRFHQIPGGRVTPEGLEEVIAAKSDQVRSADDAEALAERSVEDWQSRVDEECDAADEARRRYEECEEARAAAEAPPPEPAEEPPPPEPQPETTASGPPPPPVEPVEERAPPPPPPPSPACPEGATQLRNERSIDVDLPVRLLPLISGGGAHDAAEEAEEIGAVLAVGEDAAKALGRIFSLAPNASIVREVKVSNVAGAGAFATSEATGIPIPTNIPTAVANVSEVVVKAARVIITKVTELQERRLPDVDLTVVIMKAPYRLACAEVWVCRGGRWVLEGKRFTITCTGPERNGGSRRWEGLTWAQAQQHVVGMEPTFRSSLEQALRKMADFEKSCTG